jgi:hypothetical protein
MLKFMPGDASSTHLIPQALHALLQTFEKFRTKPSDIPEECQTILLICFVDVEVLRHQPYTQLRRTASEMFGGRKTPSTRYSHQKLTDRSTPKRR